ncbi:MAG TPA: chorismate synthase [bacterium]|nr:chorismate synthase [bacterium]HPN43294.1 chorismate synthase [bacterium]
MSRIRFLTAGESHGRALTTIIEGLPAGLEISETAIEHELQRRQRGYGRGDRMKIEHDRARILSGVRYGVSLGSPVSLLLENKDWINWTEKMSVTPVEHPTPPLQMPRPGHADFAGMVKYRQDDLRNLLERSSARETTMRVAVGAICKKLLEKFHIHIYGHITRIGSVTSPFSVLNIPSRHFKNPDYIKEFATIFKQVEESPMACADSAATTAMVALVDDAKQQGTSLGGQFELIATGLPVGLGSHVHWDRKLDAQIAAALMSINAIKAVEIGLGVQVAHLPGNKVHDQLYYTEAGGYYRGSNNAGGIEGGMSNGEPIVVKATMKPLPTMIQPLDSVNVATHTASTAHYERADVCAAPAAVVVGEAMLAIVLADALYEKLGGDSIPEMLHNFRGLSNVPLGW